jgi:signal transduction histidine kinase
MRSVGAGVASRPLLAGWLRGTTRGMDLAADVTLLACAAVLALSVLVILGGSRSAVGPPLAALALDVFCWNFADLACRGTGYQGWHWLDIGSSPLTPVLALHVVLAFAGRLRRLRWPLIASYCYFGLLAVVSALGAVFTRLAAFTAARAWPIVFLLGVAPTMGLALWVLWRHLRAATDPEERTRTGFLFGAFGLVTVVGSTELWNDLWPAVPRLGGLATLAGVMLLARVALRFRLFDRDLPASAALEALLLAAAAFAGCLSAFHFFGGKRALLALTLALVTLVLFAGLRSAFRGFAARRDRLERLAVLGNLSAQFAHDVKNPLAALKGAAQYLQEEEARGRAGASQKEFVDLIAAQADRLQRVVDHYQRLGRVEPLREPLRVNEVVQGVLALQQFAAGGAVAIASELEADLPVCRADRDLIGLALENLIKNAFEAMPKGGRVTVRTQRWSGDDGPEILLSVQDTGMGMNARTLAKAEAGLFTTKARGSGLGVVFARRVAEAHGGSLSLTSAEGRGTIVRLHLPAV